MPGMDEVLAARRAARASRSQGRVNVVAVALLAALFPHWHSDDGYQPEPWLARHLDSGGNFLLAVTQDRQAVGARGGAPPWQVHRVTWSRPVLDYAFRGD